MSDRLSPETVRCLRALFAENEWAEVSQLLLKECGNNLSGLEKLDEFELERFRFAAMKISNGRADRLKDAVELAKKDWRDLLTAAKFWTKDSHKTWFPGTSR